MPSKSFTKLLLNERLNASHANAVIVNGQTLTITDVVAVSRLMIGVKLDPRAIEVIRDCPGIIEQKLANGEIIYGISTGFGGSANTRPTDVAKFQQCLVSHLLCGILSEEESKYKPKLPRHEIALPLNDPVAATCMPDSWVRASMLIRLNSLCGGASGIRPDVAQSLAELLNNDIVPRIPVRGSISASGDLSALAWVAAVMQGKHFATACSGARHVKGARKVLRADAALAGANISPVTLHARESLAIVNGTAVSAGVAALAAYEALNLAALSQVLTAMSVEALRGSDESFEPFIAYTRPHPGQIDCARNIMAFLSGSKFLDRHDSKITQTVRQDRYSLRTSSQWVGPVLEDFQLAHEQITTELNSVTDNPLIDASSGRVFHGGNFQARAVTSATEKLRQGLQSIGRMLFAQCTEMMNPATSWGLPPNLCTDEPEYSYLFKGLDVVVAALTSELGFLANPVGSHVQTAEMGNQAINSLALVSARYTLEAADVLSQLASAHLLAVCQALDLRTLEIDRSNLTSPDATPYLGKASRKMYHFVRKELAIPLLGEEILSQSNYNAHDTCPNIGFYNTKIYEAIRSGRVYDIVTQCLVEATT
ncbi:L-Aspartase-like protein [Xylariaceae sp. FL0662B]|nr:L-Aspartase-like protein [Xylariaceae sp. FL0662B]